MWAHADSDTRPASRQQGTVQSKLPILVLPNDLMARIFSSIAPGHRGAVLKCFRPPLLLDQIVAVTQNAGGELGTLRDQISITFL
jgi:hypothetical protein